MSAMQPWAMIWGKLLGASSYGWYGGALALLVAIPSALSTEFSPQVFTMALTAIVAGLGLQSLLVAIHLQRVKVGGAGSQRGGVAALVMVLLWTVPAMLSTFKLGEVQWWDITFSASGMLLISSILFTACAVCAAWRLMAEVLAVRQVPWGLAGFAVLVGFYVAGFSGENRALIFGSGGLITCAVITYGLLLAEPQQRTVWQKVVARWQEGDWRGAVRQLPGWAVILLLAMLFAFWITLEAQSVAHTGALWLDAFHSRPLVLVLTMVRDSAIALFFWFSPKPRRASFAFGLTLVVLHALLPWLVKAAGGELTLQLIIPYSAGEDVAWLGTIVQLAIAVAALTWRWRTTAPV